MLAKTDRWSRRCFLNRATAAAAVTTFAPAVGRAQSGARLRVAAVPADTFAEAYYAADEGFFQRAGLDVEMFTFASGSSIATAVTAGAADVGITNPMSLATALVHGIPLRFLCTGGICDVQVNPDATALCVANGSPIDRASELNGLSVAVPGLNDTNSLAVHGWIDQNGGDSTTVHFIEMPFTAMPAALGRGTIAAATIPDPLFSAVKKTDVRALRPPLYSAFGRRFMSGGWFASMDWINKNSDLARRFVASIYATAKWANRHHDESAIILAKYTKIDVDTIRAMSRCPYPESTPDDLLARVLELAYEYKYVDRLFKPNQLVAKLN